MAQDPQNPENEIEQMRNADLSPAMVAQVKAPKKTWFFKRLGDGFIFPAEEREAWDICFNKSTWKRRDFQLIGTSDGKTYNKIVEESMGRAQELEPEIAKVNTELEKYMRAEERLMMDEIVDMDGDPADEENERNKKKVLRLREIMDKLHAKLDALEEEHRSVSSGIVKKATDAEMKVAMANQKKRLEEGLDVDWPDSDLNIITPNADKRGRDKVLGVMQMRRN